MLLYLNVNVKKDNQIVLQWPIVLHYSTAKVPAIEIWIALLLIPAVLLLYSKFLGGGTLIPSGAVRLLQIRE